jgi:hypothetical protein
MLLPNPHNASLRPDPTRFTHLRQADKQFHINYLGIWNVPFQFGWGMMQLAEMLAFLK